MLESRESRLVLWELLHPSAGGAKQGTDIPTASNKTRNLILCTILPPIASIPKRLNGLGIILCTDPPASGPRQAIFVQWQSACHCCTDCLYNLSPTLSHPWNATSGML